MGQTVNQLVTVERFEGGVAMLQARIDVAQTVLQTRTNAVRTDMRAKIARNHLISVGVINSANALMVAKRSFILTRGA